MIQIILLLLGREIIQRNWRMLLAVSIVWILAGAFIVVDALDGVTLIPSRFFGYLLLPEAVVSFIAAFGRQGTARRMRFLQSAALFTVALLILSARPASNFILAMLLGLCFLVDGGIRIGSAWVVRYPRWKWGLAGGIGEVLLAIATLQPWPTWYAGTVGSNVGAVMILTGAGLLMIAMRIRRLHEGASFSSLLSRNPFWHYGGKLRDDGETHTNEVIVHVWTPTGTAMTPLRRRAIERYIAAVDANGVISTGHAALQMGDDLYISHYPATEIDRSPEDFARTLRATADNDVPGRFLTSYEEEAAEWCPSTVQVVITNIDAKRLRTFWENYRADNTYNLTNRNCSSAVANALDAAVEGVYGKRHRRPIIAALRAILHPELWAAALMRQRAETMAWTPGLVLDYARALSAIVDPPTMFWDFRRFRLFKKYAGVSNQNQA
ncbi:HdeD family acid-resistance protein [Daeguia caeni]|uniref:HdeD family acid-resistance protein n=1 Tax=Daeguia caeni TaxID=439612 RepID=A0ABV9H7H1_9HYPH